MSRKQRTESTQFSVGEIVRVRDCIATQYVGCIGTILSARASRHARTLDKYRVRFASGAEVEFWDIQLELPPGVLRENLEKQLDLPAAGEENLSEATH